MPKYKDRAYYDDELSPEAELKLVKEENLKLKQEILLLKRRIENLEKNERIRYDFS